MSIEDFLKKKNIKFETIDESLHTDDLDENKVLFDLKEKFETVPQIWRELGKQYLKRDVEQDSHFGEKPIILKNIWNRVLELLLEIKG